MVRAVDNRVMDGSIAIRAAVLQGASVAVLSIALAVALPKSFFEDWGWLAGPGAWMLCALLTASLVALVPSAGAGETPTCVGLPATVVLADGDDPTGGDDVIVGTAGPDTIRGLGGDDTICGRAGDDDIGGGEGRDRIFGGADEDSLRSGPGGGLLAGNDENDDLTGGRDNDTLRGGADDDDLTGRRGNDLHNGGAGTDTCNLDVGRDTVQSCEAISIP